MLINTTLDLKSVCDDLIQEKPNFIAVDTEFVRNNSTYYPRLSLIQISYNGKSFIVDALATGIDLSLIKDIMLNNKIVKIFHSCKQDLETIFTVFKCIPTPIFDTQIAAMFCDYYYDFISYSKLVNRYCGLSLNKIKVKNSDWLKRPLSKDKLNYAISDVLHLCDLYHILLNKLEENNRISWFNEEMESLCDINNLRNPKNAWKRIKFNGELNPRMVLIIKAVSEWQEILAQRYDLNRNKIIDSSVIVGFLEKNIERVDEILECLRNSNVNMKEEDLLEFINIFNENENCFVEEKNINLKKFDKSVFDIISIILDAECKKNKISRKLVLSKDDLIYSISGKVDKLFKGWRHKFFGRSIESFLNSELKLEISILQSSNSRTKIENSLVSINYDLKSTIKI